VRLLSTEPCLVDLLRHYSNRADLLEQLRRAVVILSEGGHDSNTGPGAATEGLIRSRRLRDRFLSEDLQNMIDLYRGRYHCSAGSRAVRCQPAKRQAAAAPARSAPPPVALRPEAVDANSPVSTSPSARAVKDAPVGGAVADGQQGCIPTRVRHAVDQPRCGGHRYPASAYSQQPGAR
jgi:hypothetical protein